MARTLPVKRPRDDDAETHPKLSPSAKRARPEDDDAEAHPDLSPSAPRPPEAVVTLPWPLP